MKLATTVLVVYLIVPGAIGAADPSQTADASMRPVLTTFHSALVASGIGDPTEQARLEGKFVEQAEELQRRLGRIRSPYRRARRLHEALHAGALSRYRASADGLHEILDRGEYNCVSATIFEGLLSEALGLPAEIVASPKHVHLQLRLDGRDVEVESTSPEGFDAESNLAAFARFAVAYKLATQEEVEDRGAAAIFQEFHQLAVPVSLERGVAFLWHNSAQRALERGDAEAAAHALREEFGAAPDIARASESTPWCLARAFRIEYEARRFDSAYRIAALDVEVFPGKTTPADRLLAAAIKRIEIASATGDAAAAEEILTETRGLAGSDADAARLDREACPRIASAAMRGEDWARARRMALRFLLVEPDAVEAARLVAWVEARKEDGTTALFSGAAASFGRVDTADLSSSLLDSSSPFPLASPAGPLRGRKVGPSPRATAGDPSSQTENPGR